MKSPILSLTALTALLALAACGTERIVLCPGTAILADTASERVFRPGAPLDPSGVAVSAAITDISADCVYDKDRGDTISNLDVDFKATRPPTADPASYNLTYFVTTNAGDRLLAKRMFQVRFDFAPGSATATASASPDGIIVNLEPGHLPTDYELLVGFQLTAEQLAYNRKMGRYVP